MKQKIYYKITREKGENKMDKIMILEIVCPFCGAEYEVEVPFDEWVAYTQGALAQDAFKSLNATERECIISHICPKCQADIF